MEGGSNQTLSEDVVKQFMSQHFTEDKTKLSSEANKLITKLVDLFVRETIQRTLKQCEVETRDELNVDHLEKILPQLLLDF